MGAGAECGFFLKILRNREDITLPLPRLSPRKIAPATLRKLAPRHCACERPRGDMRASRTAIPCGAEGRRGPDAQDTSCLACGARSFGANRRRRLPAGLPRLWWRVGPMGGRADGG